MQQDIDRLKADASLGKTVSAPSQQNPHSAFLKLIQMSSDALGGAVHGSKLIQLDEADTMLHATKDLLHTMPQIAITGKSDML